MKRHNFTAVLSLAALLLVHSRGYSMFDDTGFMARIPGMSGAGMAITDDVNSVFYNPAGLYRLKNPEMTASFTKLYWGLSDDTPGINIFSAAVPLKYLFPDNTGDYLFSGSAAVSYKNTGNGGYNEHTAQVTYATLLPFSLRAGLNLKMLYLSFAEDAYTKLDPVFSFGKKYSVSGFALDFGARYKYKQNLELGFAAENIITPDMGFIGSEPVGRRFRLGSVFKIGRTPFAADFILDSGIRFATGFERWFMDDRFAFRSGISFGNMNFSLLSFGFSYNNKLVQVDYAFSANLSGAEGSNGSHRVSFYYRFDLISQTVPADSTEIKPVQSRILSPAPARAVTEERSAPKKKEEKPSSYVVREGDTLHSIAEKFYGDAKFWHNIFQANREKVKRGRVETGTEIILP